MPADAGRIPREEKTQENPAEAAAWKASGGRARIIHLRTLMRQLTSIFVANPSFQCSQKQ
jgi:hypothetical protein